MQRIDSGSCKASADAARRRRRAGRATPRRLLLPGGRACGLQARIEDAAVGAESLHGQRGGLLLLAE